MLCDRCKKNKAVTTVTQTVNGHSSVLHLCGECADELEVAAFFSGPFLNASDLFSGFFRPEKATEHSAKRCPKCGATLDEILSTGHFGCCECMTVFRNELLPMIRKIHGNAAHIGKIPQNASVGIKSKRQLEQLEQKLREAVEKQEFERAAQLRDEIKSLETAGEAE